MSNKHVWMRDKSIHIGCDPLELPNKEHMRLITSRTNEHLSHKILTTRYKADNFSGHVTLEPHKGSHFGVVPSWVRSPFFLLFPLNLKNTTPK